MMFWEDPRFWNALLASSVACLITVSGLFAIYKMEAWARKQVLYFISFAAGVLISVALIHVVPESMALNANASGFFVVGFFGMHILNRVLATCTHDFTHVDHRTALLALLSIGFHALVDGSIYSITFQAGAFTGWLSALGLATHKFPEGIITTLLLLEAGFDKKRAVKYAFWASAATTPIGMMISYPFISHIAASNMGALLAASAGALLYTGAVHLIPKTEEHENNSGIVAMLLGVAVAFLIVLMRG